MSRILILFCLMAFLTPVTVLAQSKPKPQKKLEQKWLRGRGSMKYKIFKSGDSLRVREGGLVTLHLAWFGQNLKQAAFDTRQKGEPSVFNTLPSPYPGSLEEGLLMMCRGDSGVFELQSDSMFSLSFGGKIPAEAVGLQRVMVSIKVIDTDPNETFEEREKQRKRYEADNEERRKNEQSNIERFLYMNQIAQERDTSGVWYKIISNGHTALKPKYGDKVTFRMTGRVLDGTIIEGSAEKPVNKEFIIGTDPVPIGLSKGIQLMNLGEKALLIIPSELGFGHMHMGKIPPYSTLLLEVELLDIKPKKP